MPSSPASRRLRQGAAVAILAGLAAAAASALFAGRLPRADFTFNNATEIQSLDPATVTGVPEGRVLRAIYEGLVVKHPETLAPLPGVAETWSVSDDGLDYRFELRDGAVWSDGAPLDAHDFEYSWRRLLDPETAAEYAYLLWGVEGAEAWSMLREDRRYDAEAHAWWSEVEPGLWRIGLSGFALDGAGAQALEPLAGPDAVGVRLADGRELRAPLPDGARVASRNAELPLRVAALAGGLYDDHWLAEVEVDAPPAGLLGVEEYRERTWRERVGVRASDDGRTFHVRLKQPTPYFLDLCAFYPLFPVSRRAIADARERWPASWRIEWLRAENLVTNGPYRVAFRRVNDRLRLVKNERYWDAEHIAFDTIDVLAVDHLGTSLNLYLTGEVDWIDRPIAGVIPRLLPREDFEPAPYLGTYFYRVNTNEPPFDDVRVRRALALSIDRRAVTDKITKSGELPAYGIVPRSLAGWEGAEFPHSTSAPTYEGNLARDREEARRLLAEAGFGPEGDDFPTFEILYNTDQTHKDVAEVLAREWKEHLGIDAKTLNQEWKVYLDSQRTLDYDVSRSAWIGDYLDANSFLELWVTGNENNRTGWGDPRYDALIAAAAKEPDAAERQRLLTEAEAILMEALPVIPIYDYTSRNLVNPRLGGFYGNALDEHYPKFWYWMDDAELAEKRAGLPPDAVRVEARGPSDGQYPPAGRDAVVRPGDADLPRGEGGG